jgi:hypothetical protein
MKIRPVVTELFHADGRVEGNTDTEKLIVTFHNFSNPRNNKEQKPKGLQNTDRRWNHSDCNKQCLTDCKTSTDSFLSSKYLVASAEKLFV